MSPGWYRVLALVGALVVTVLGARLQTDLPMTDDAAQNVRTAYHVVHTGVWGNNDAPTPTPEPQVRREPLPILLIAAYLVLDPAFDTAYDIDDILLGGPLTERIKQGQLLWVFLGVLAIFFLAPAMTRSRLSALIVAASAVALSTPLYFLVPSYLDRYTTEMPATALLLWAAVLGVRALDTGRILHLVLFGAVLGALIMTKASFHYVIPPFLVILLVLQLMRSPREVRRKVPLGAGIVLMALVTVCAPWVIRNALVFNEFIVTTRGGDILALRTMLLDQPIAGRFYVYSPSEYRAFMGPLTGYTEADLGPGATLGRLDRSVETSRWDYYEEWLAAEGLVYQNRVEAEALLADLAIRQILDQPAAWLASIPAVYYRGIWSLEYDRLFRSVPRDWRMMLNHLTVVSHVVFFLLGLFSIVAGRPRLFVIVGLAVGWLLFHAAFSHNLPRYGSPPIPLMMVSFVWLAYRASLFLARVLPRRAGAEVAASPPEPAAHGPHAAP